MTVLVTGDSSSGKSFFAEDLAAGVPGDTHIYLATMIAGDAESIERIEKHREKRRGKGFITIECPVDIITADIPEGSVVLLECMSNLTANELFREEMPTESRDRDAYGNAARDACDRILAGIGHIKEKASELVIVTNEVFEDAGSFEEGTEVYRKLLGGLNQELAKESDEVYEVVCGIPLRIK